ncbi:hypothetical protein JQX09_04310 [Sulfitobacter pseudonitzschiae]|uniref:Membrane-associated oxidoreductase n=1 Tax=Pseudosulfitobacter pseudonitzschiae TaxID=1402135 RepID=A0A9Q2NLL6_9RHOB|nr:hypothetical protein [Pseudosulfitobacter pseudonitzschiae]MBM2291115.1 hypothetical protein [Pseudosulfitobacter pseudonitzschiae]MBM2296033.1 hypothetical protein [Pseudosulfitobacter pseudonitzschiae]MBM2300946.1 hypothetical protein [Pseudosulfitobacter pseudonitzschiae]MBM2310730.1 hypothetical protein [Pseudosulfitobacter pseudonitzschiae]MBM2315643.1 hypothetical protein [Pseudosulfitobacter pseudonitzschiae]
MNNKTHSPRSIQTWADWKAAVKNKSCTEAEIALVTACREGRQCELGDGTRPDMPTPQNQIGADLLRYLIKGGCDACDLHDWGVDLVGAYITGDLDLRLVKATGVTGMRNCHFDAAIDAMNARFHVLHLGGSRCPGLLAQGAEVKGDVFLRNGFTANGDVSLSGAVIGGQLSCGDGSFDSPAGHALNAQSAEVKGDVFFTNGFVAKGVVRLSSAVIGGQLNCGGGSFDNAVGDALNAQDVQVKGGVFLDDGFAAKGAVTLSGAVIGGQLACNSGSFEVAGGRSLEAQGAKANGLIWRNVKTCVGSINLSGARLQNLFDDADSWNFADKIFLDGLTYQTIHGPLDTKMRLKWLAMARAYDGSFSPQPYEQLAWTLKRMGHNEQRRVVLVEKEKRQRSYERETSANGFLGTRFLWMYFKDVTAWLLVGYGYRPFRFLWVLVLLIGTGWGVAHMAYEQGDFAPNSDVILSTPDWQALAEGDSANPARDWAAATGKGRDYETFHSLAYAFDVVIPIISIGQEAAWAPSTTRGPWGAALWWLRWILTGLGWIVTAVGAAAITGVIRRD